MKILVTGLCLSRNLGGPAMGLTLISKLRDKFDDIEFTFAVDDKSYEIEKIWSEYYNIPVVRRDKLISHITTQLKIREIKNLFKGKYASKLSQYQKQVHQEFMTAYKMCDLVIDMSGITYVGDGVRGPLEGLRQYSFYYYSKKKKRPFCRFIQSFGPFDDWRVRIFAKNEFKNLDFIPARGKQSAFYCKEIVRDKDKVHDFPDSAILLPKADVKWTSQYLKNKKLVPKDFFILSPSSVIYNISEKIGGSVAENHVKSFSLLAEALIHKGKKVFFLPHMYSEVKTDSDREICVKIINDLKNKNIHEDLVSIMNEDLDPMQTKAIISESELAIVSRYHALVAAVSTLTPVIAVGWNIKYLDLLDYYGLEDMAIDVRNYLPDQLCSSVLEKIEKWQKMNAQKDYEQMHIKNIKKVESAFELLYKWIDKNYVRQ